MKKSITAEYIESGTFQGGEEEAFQAGIKYGETVVILKKDTFKALNQRIRVLEKRLGDLLTLSGGRP